MIKGIKVQGLAFYELLIQDDTFCAELGRATLAAGKLENILLKAVSTPKKQRELKRLTLGQLINIIEQEEDYKKLTPHLKLVSKQRNYLTHNIYNLLSDTIEETILERKNLLESDITTYTERAFILRQNLGDLHDLIEKILN